MPISSAQEDVFHSLRLALEQLVRQQQMGNAPLHYQDELLTRIDQILRQLQAVQQPGQGALESPESVVRLRQENRD